MTENPAADESQLTSALEHKLKEDASAKDAFCRCWPCTREVLQLLLKLPTLPKQVVDAIKAIVAVGDKASAVVCK